MKNSFEMEISMKEENIFDYGNELVEFHVGVFISYLFLLVFPKEKKKKRMFIYRFLLVEKNRN